MIVSAVLSRAGQGRWLTGRHLLACLVALVLLIATAGCGSFVPTTSSTAVATTDGSAAAQAAVWASNALGMRLLSRVDPASNAVISPYSIETALAMLLQGARGATLTQMETVLNGNAPQTLASSNRTLASQIALASTAFPENGHATLDAAASLWLKTGLKLDSAFQDAISANFGALTNEVDFGSPAGAIEQINSWAAAHTGGLIRKLVSSATVSSQTSLLLATAVYLRAQWKHPFDSSLTHPAPFHLASGATRAVSMMQMQQAARLPYASTSTYKAVELPYRASNLAMVAVLPKAGDFKQLLGTLNASTFQSLESSLQTQQRELVQMPKVSLAVNTNLAGPLAQLGMPAAFGSGADFDGIASGAKLHVQSVAHAALMRVYESGTTAAAATGISVSPTIATVTPQPTIVFNRPYYLFLIDRATGAALFAARVTDPGQAASSA